MSVSKKSKDLTKNEFCSKKRPYSEVETKKDGDHEDEDLNLNKKVKLDPEEESVAKVDTHKNPFKKEDQDCLETFETFVGELGNWSEPLKLTAFLHSISIFSKSLKIW